MMTDKFLNATSNFGRSIYNNYIIKMTTFIPLLNLQLRRLMESMGLKIDGTQNLITSPANKQFTSPDKQISPNKRDGA